MEQAMNCAGVEREEVAERYAAGTLSVDEAEAFEEHYFRCAACLERLELVQNGAIVLQRPFRTRRVPYAVWALAASLMIVFAGTLVWKLAPGGKAAEPVTTARVETPRNPWAELGKFEAPVYRESRLRGEGGNAGRDFHAAMAMYQQGHFAQAVPLLRAVEEANPSDVKAIFLLGVSQILAGDTDTGLDTLRRVDAMGLTAYQEEARFYQAKALLLRGDATGARGVLEAVVAMQGDWQSPAVELLAKLPR